MIAAANTIRNYGRYSEITSKAMSVWPDSWPDAIKCLCSFSDVFSFMKFVKLFYTQEVQYENLRLYIWEDLFFLALFVCWWLRTSEMNGSPDCIFPCCDTSDVFRLIASDGSLMLCYPNSLYAGIIPEMEEHWGFSHLCASPGNSRWAWSRCLLYFSLFQQRLELAYCKARWAKVSVDSHSKQLL